MTRTLSLAGRVALVSLVIGGAILGLTNPIGPTGLEFIPYAGVGALLIIRRPRTSIGWILLGLGSCYALVSVPVGARAEQFADGTVGLPVALFATIHSGLGTTAFFLFAVLAMVFPSGRLPAGRWGRLGRVGLGAGLVLTAAAYVLPVIYVGYPASEPVRNPAALFPELAIWRVINQATVILPIMVLVIAGLVSLGVRVRRARGTERQQLRWFAASIAVLMSAVVGGLVISYLVPGSEDGLAWIPAMVAFPSVPVAIGIAVLRYRLYEIDRIISRTISYGVVSATLVAVYAALILILQGSLGAITDGDTVAVAASTLVAAALFQPVRRRTQAAVDHRFNRARYDAERTVAGFSARLREEVDIATVTTDLHGTVQRSVNPSSLSLWIREARP